MPKKTTAGWDRFIVIRGKEVPGKVLLPNFNKPGFQVKTSIFFQHMRLIYSRTKREGYDQAVVLQISSDEALALKTADVAASFVNEWAHD